MTVVAEESMSAGDSGKDLFCLLRPTVSRGDAWAAAQDLADDGETEDLGHCRPCWTTAWTNLWNSCHGTIVKDLLSYTFRYLSWKPSLSSTSSQSHHIPTVLAQGQSASSSDWSMTLYINEQETESQWVAIKSDNIQHSLRTPVWKWRRGFFWTAAFFLHT